MDEQVIERVDREKFSQRWARNFEKSKYLYLMLLPLLVYYFIFHYIPMGGAIIAFQNYKPALGFFRSPWVGFMHFKDFFTGPYAWRLIRNTLLLNVYQIIFGFPVPIFLALMINEVRLRSFKKVVQTISYMPHFISLVVICGMLVTFSRTDGLFNDVRVLIGLPRLSLLAENSMFRTIFTASGIWQTMGWGSIIYLSALSGVDPNLYEAASLDGAGRIKKIIHVSFPALTPIIIIQLIMRIGNILTQGFEKIILLYSPLVYENADVISSYVYRRGLQEMDYSFGAAMGIFNSVINLIILITANYLARRYWEESLW
jgi:putative aldouronate transport system permease protein